MSIDDDYWSHCLGNVKEDMIKFSEIAKEIDTTLENVLRYVMIRKISEYNDDSEIIKYRLSDILDSLDEIKRAIEYKE